MLTYVAYFDQNIASHCNEYRGYTVLNVQHIVLKTQSGMKHNIKTKIGMRSEFCSHFTHTHAKKHMIIVINKSKYD